LFGLFYLGNEKSKTNRKTSQIRNAKQQQIRSPVHDEDEPDISNEGNESYLEGKIIPVVSLTQMLVLCDSSPMDICVADTSGKIMRLILNLCLEYFCP